jgi:hypothetical protein
MSIEAEIGRTTNEILNAVTDAVSSELVRTLKNDCGLNDQQIQTVLSITNSTIMNVGLNGVSRLSAIYNRHVENTATSVDAKHTISSIFSR